MKILSKHRMPLPATVLVALVAAALLVLPAPALAWDDCPKGLEYDPYPGACSRYVDTNDNGICDLSEPAPTPTTTAPETITSTPPTTAGDSTTTTTTADDDGSTAAVGPVDPNSGGGASGDGTLLADVSGGSATVAGGGSTPTTPPPANLTTKYNFGPIAIIFLLVYFVSFALYKTGRMRVLTHRRIWNVMLLVTFLMTGILGTLLTIQLNYGLGFQLPFSMLFWHVEAGVAMTIVSMFHVAWHARYYLNCFFPSRRRSRRSAREANAARERERIDAPPRGQDGANRPAARTTCR